MRERERDREREIERERERGSMIKDLWNGSIVWDSMDVARMSTQGGQCQ